MLCMCVHVCVDVDGAKKNTVNLELVLLTVSFIFCTKSRVFLTTLLIFRAGALGFCIGTSGFFVVGEDFVDDPRSLSLNQ